MDWKWTVWRKWVDNRTTNVKNHIYKLLVLFTKFVGKIEWIDYTISTEWIEHVHTSGQQKCNDIHIKQQFDYTYNNKIIQNKLYFEV